MTRKINDELRITKSGLRFGPERISRVQTIPPDTLGRNGDIVIVDNTAESIVDQTIAIRHVPDTVSLCQKIPLTITPGDFTIDDGTTVFTITIASLDDIVDAVNAANIPAFSAFVDLRDNDFRGPIIFRGIPVTIADGTSDFPSVVGIAGVFGGGDLEVITGTWECFATGLPGVNLEFAGTPVAGGPFSTLDFTGAGVSSVVDAGGGEATITIAGGGGGGTAYGVIVGDVGSSTATVAAETITFGGIGVTVTATNAGAGLDTVSFDLDVSDLPAGVTVALTNEIGVDQGAAPNVRFTFTDVLEDLDIPFGITTNGLLTRTAADTYVSRTIIASTTAGLEGSDIVNGDGVAGNPEVGVDIDNLTSSVSDLAAADELIVFDGANNLSYTGQQIADGVSTIIGIISNSYAFIVGGDGGVTAAAISADTITFNGEGINITTTNAGAGLDTIEFDLDISDLGAGVTVAFGDFIAVDQSADPNVRFTFTDVVEDLDIPNAITSDGLITRTAADTYASRTITASVLAGDEGISVVDGDGVAGNPTIGVDITGQPFSPNDLAAGDEFLGFDGSNNVSFTGTQIADGVETILGGPFTTLSFATWARAGNGSGASLVADAIADTVTITGGIGVDIDTAPGTDTATWTFSRSGMADTAVTTSDTVPFFDVTNSNEPEFRSWGDIITDLSLGGIPAAYSFIAGGDGGVTAAAVGSDTITFNGEGINITTANAGAGLDTVAFDLDISDLAAGVTITLSDQIAVDQAADPNVRFTFTSVVGDLDIPNAITVNGFVVRTAADTYASRTIDASTDEDELGIIVTNGDGVSGDPQIGLDIDGTTSSPAEMASTDEFLVHDKSEGTGGANRSMTGQQLADGANTLAGPNLWETISSDSGSTAANTRTDTLTIAGGTGITTAIAGDTVTITNSASAVITISTIDGQPVPTFSDTTRGPKTLSVETVPFVWSENRIANNDWLRIGTTDDAAIGHVMPHNCTIIKVTAKTTDNNGNTKNLDLYVDDLLDTSSIVTFSGGSGEDEDIDVTLNIDITAGEKLQLRGDITGGTVEDTTVTLFVKWRA